MRSRILTLLATLATTFAWAQGFYSRGAIVSVTPQTVLTIPDSMVNTGTLINNGEIRISGAWINSGTYDPGVGQINFDGNLDQIINHNAQSIEKLVISGGGVKEFLADITVKTNLVLTSGILRSKNGARIIMDQNVVLAGGDNSSHIVGPVERKGTGTWVFPIGNGTNYLPVIVSNVTDAAAFGIVTLHELTGETLTGEKELEKVSTQRYWELVTSGGNVNGTTITLRLLNEDDLAATERLTVGMASQPTGPYADLGRSNFTGDISDGVITSNSAPTGRYYAVAVTLGDKSISVFNAVSAEQDGKNDFMEITNIAFYPSNRVTVHNRWGDKVYEAIGYDNAQKAFRGFSQNGNKLPAGTYFYTIDLGDGSKAVTGFVEVR